MEGQGQACYGEGYVLVSWAEPWGKDVIMGAKIWHSVNRVRIIWIVRTE